MKRKRSIIIISILLSLISMSVGQAVELEGKEQDYPSEDSLNINIDLAEIGFSGSVKEIVDIETQKKNEFIQKGSIVTLATSVKPADVKILKVVLDDPKWIDIRNREINPVIPKPDIYNKVQGNHIIVGNSKVELHFDKRNGAVVDLINKQTHSSYLTGTNSNSFVLYYSTERDIWRAKEYENPREGRIKVTSEIIQGKEQTLSSYSFDKRRNEITLRLRYNSLKGKGKTYNIAVEELITIRSNDELWKWNIIIRNKDRGTVISVVFPMLSDLKRLSEDDYYISAQGFGSKILDPLTQLSRRFFSWPGETAPLSRQWHEYGNREEGLYMAAYDKNLIYKTFNFGNRQGKGIYSRKRNPLNRDLKSKAEMSIKTYCFVSPGNRWESFDFMVGLHKGDWRWSADRYREWFMSWAKKPEVPRWYKENFDYHYGGILTQDDRVEIRYSEMKNVYTRKNEMIQWSGWHKGGHDDSYPEYIPIPRSQFSWGGEENLRRAIRDIHRRGGRVGLYTNGHIIDVGTKTYANTGGDFSTRKPGSWDAIDRNGKAYCEVYGSRTFTVPDPFVIEWQETYAAYARKIAECGADGMQVDQVGLRMPQLCYNKDHGHPTPANGPAIGTLTFLRKTREAVRKINPNFVMYPEYHSDAFIQYLDDPGGWCCGDYGRHVCKETGLKVINLPEIYRYTLPEYPRIHQYPTRTPDRYAYPFILGNRFSPDTDFKDFERATQYVTISNRESEYFIDGRFMDTIGLRISDSKIEGKAHVSINRDSFIIALWNPSRIRESEIGLEEEAEEIHTETMITADEAVALVKKDIRIQSLLSEHPRAEINSYFVKEYRVWVVEFFVGDEKIASAFVSDETEKVVEVDYHLSDSK